MFICILIRISCGQNIWQYFAQKELIFPGLFLSAILYNSNNRGTLLEFSTIVISESGKEAGN